MPLAEALPLPRAVAPPPSATTALDGQKRSRAMSPPAPLRMPARAGAAPGAPGSRSTGPPAARVAQLRLAQRTLGNRAAQRVAARYVESAAPDAVQRQPAAVQRQGPQADAPAGDAAPWWQALAFGESVAWRLMAEFAPQLVPIVRRGPSGVLDWLGERVMQAASAAFAGLMRPVQAIAGTGEQLLAQCAPLLGSLREAAAAIAANDCSPIGRAAAQIERAAERVVTPVVERLQPVLARVQSFLGDVWDRIGAPVVSWVQEYAAQQWAQLQQLAGWIWSFGEPMRALGADAWAWLQRQIGIGEAADAGEGGVMQWVQGRLEGVWQRVQATLAPFGQQVAAIRSTVAGAVGVIAGPFVQLAGLARQAGSGIASIARHLADVRGLLDARIAVERLLIPPLTAVLRRVTGAVGAAATSLKGALDTVAGGIDAAAGALGDTALSFLASTVQWVAAQAHALANWAGAQLAAIGAALDTAVAGLRGFLQTLGDFLHRLQTVASDVWALPMFLAERVWHAIPACLRDPVVDFVVPLILRQIELFRDLARDGDAWQRTREQVMGIVRRVFVTRDLVGAVKGAFELVLRVFNLPPEMLADVAAKAMTAWGTVSRRPLEFIKNAVRSLGHGFLLLWNNITTHLEHGIEGWLFGELAEQGVRPPASWTDPRAVFGFVTDVLGLSVAHVLDLLRRRIDPALVERVSTWVGRFARAWDWLNDAIDTSRSPAENARGLIEQARDFGRSVLTGVAEWVAGRVAEELAVLGAAAAASGGLSEVLDVARRVYRAMLTARRWAARILEMASQTLDHVLDIAAGNVGKVGAAFETVMDRAMPVVIGFLADQVGLGGIPVALREIVGRLRQSVDNAILWLIDRIRDGIAALVRGIRAGASAVANWWDRRVRFTANGQPHTLRFRGPSADDLLVESTPMPVRQFLADVEPLITTPALRTAHTGAELLYREVAAEAAGIQAHTGEVDMRRAEALNALLERLAAQLEPLILLRSPEYAAIQEDDWILLLRYNRLARVVGTTEMNQIPALRYEELVVSRRRRAGEAPSFGRGGTGALLMQAEHEAWERVTPGARQLFLGANPSKAGQVGQAVVSRMVGHGQIVFTGAQGDLSQAVVRYEHRDYLYGDCQMGHLIDAVSWWNSNGRLLGPNQMESAVRAFMNDPDNYILQPADINMEAGRRLAERGIRYRPPVWR